MADPLFALIGIKTTHLGGGLAGGIMRYVLFGGNWKEAVSIVTAGLLSAAWLTPGAYFLLVHYFPFMADPGIEGALGFLVGLTGLMLCEGFIVMVKQWAAHPSLPFFKGSQDQNEKETKDKP